MRLPKITRLDLREALLTDIIEAEWRAMIDAALECSTKQTEK